MFLEEFSSASYLQQKNDSLEVPSHIQFACCILTHAKLSPTDNFVHPNECLTSMGQKCHFGSKSNHMTSKRYTSVDCKPLNKCAKLISNNISERNERLFKSIQYPSSQPRTYFLNAEGFATRCNLWHRWGMPPSGPPSAPG